MKVAATALLLFAAVAAVSGFAPQPATLRTSVAVQGYLDDLSKELYAPTDNPDTNNSLEETNLAKEKVDRYGVGDWNAYVDFDEFDGGDGQMGVAGDGNKGLEKFGSDVQPQLAKSKMMSAKNAWGRTTGYADTLIDQGMEAIRAQQIENWRNQQELRQRKNEHVAMTDHFDQVNHDEDWRTLAKFGIQRNQEFDMNQAFGAVTADFNIEGVIEMRSRLGQNSIHELSLVNEYMGFADFRAAFTPETPADFSVSPMEGSLSRDPVNFVVKFRPNAPGVSEGYLVIETEDFKKTWKVVGTTA